MKHKKNPQADLEKIRFVFVQIGLIVALLATIYAFEKKTYEGEIMDLGNVNLELEDDIIPITEREKPKPPPPPPPPEVIEIVEDDIELQDEIEIEETETDEEEIIEIIEEEETEEVFNFAVVEDKPVFPGCERIKDKKKRDLCFQQKIIEHINNVYKYPPIAKDMGIQGKVYVSFVIDKLGRVKGIKVVRSVDKHLDEEAARIVGTFPKFTPAKQRGRAVQVAYTVPISFKLQ